MKKKLWLVILVISCVLKSQYAGATIILEEVELFSGGTVVENYTFVADEIPLIYELVLTDFEFPVPLENLMASISTSTDFITSLSAPGTTTFGVDFGTTYFATVTATAGTNAQELGQFSILIQTSPIPEPSTLLLAIFSMASVCCLRRRR